MSLDAPTEICAASDALSTIKTLQTRVERLEESLGQLILEKEALQNHAPYERGNCCVSVTDASTDLERALAASGGNCCVRFGSKKVDPKKEAKKNAAFFILAILFIVLAFVVAREAVHSGMKGTRHDVQFENN